MSTHANTPVHAAITRIAVQARHLVAVLVLSFSASPPASATEDGFSPIFSGTLNGDFVTTGRYTRVFGVPTAQTNPFAVTLSGIPAGSTVVKAFANWTYLTDLPGDPGEASITINGNPVLGTVALGDPDAGWGKATSASYTADVTSLVTGNGVFSIGSAIDDVVSGAYGEGFSLVTVFSNPALPSSNIYVYSGLTSNTSNPPEGFAPALAKYDFTLGPYTGGPAHFFINAFDGQTGGDVFSINGINAGGILGGTGSALDAWQGKLGPAAAGNLYDHGEGNVAAFMSAGQTSLTARTALGTGAAGDAVGHSFGAIRFAGAIPEPGTALFGAGTVMALLCARRRGMMCVLGALTMLSAAQAATTQSSPVALISDDAVLVNVNLESDTISLFDATPASPAKLAEIAFGAHPASVAIHGNNLLAYVTNAAAGTVSVVNLATQLVTTPIFP